MNSIPTTEQQRIVDDEQLRLLALMHYIQGGIVAAYSSLFIIHFLMLLVLAANPNIFPQPAKGRGPEFPQELFVVFAVMLGLVVVSGISTGIATVVSGRFIKAQTHKTFSLIVAAVNCILFPYGTILGVMTLLTLSRPSIKTLYTLDRSNQPVLAESVE